MPRLHVLAGPSLDALEPITHFVNTSRAYPIHSDRFEGKVAIYIKGFINTQDQPLRSEYFERPDRKGITWSIQVQGRFLHPHSTNDILFGNTFDRPLKLPWGSSAALKFMKFVDPALEHNLTSPTKPWALSPLVATVPHFVHSHVEVQHVSEDKSSETGFPPLTSISDNTSHLSIISTSPSDASHDGTQFASKSDPKNLRFRTSSERRKYFSKEVNRKDLIFGPNDLISIDFCYGFLEFNPTIVLRLPGGITFDLMKYWDRQPVRFVCCERKKPTDGEGDDGSPIGKLFWCMSIELAEDGEARDGNEEAEAD
ncbi:hypothetical protein J3A83DRAFT_4210548 [Scleroderma citrinum]